MCDLAMKLSVFQLAMNNEKQIWYGFRCNIVYFHMIKKTCSVARLVSLLGIHVSVYRPIIKKLLLAGSEMHITLL